MAKRKKGMGGVKTALVGAAVGATAAILADPENRKAIQKTVSRVAVEGGRRLDDAKRVFDDVKDRVLTEAEEIRASKKTRRLKK